ncbi:MAG TPA: hypothetical protein VNW92_06790 [Polyangiaceae bacterium]|nr:hypothetical protein [Polyangiaceae bacterium]
MDNPSSQDSPPSSAVSAKRADANTEPPGPSHADVVAALAHCVLLANWYLNGGSARTDPNAHRLIGLMVTESLRHSDEIRWEWLEFDVARATWVASNRYPETRPTVAALAKWRADTAQTLLRALSRLGPKYKTPAAPNAQGDAEPTVEMLVERAMKNFDKLRAKRKKSGIWENLTMAVSAVFGTASVTAQREMQIDVLPHSIGADCSGQPRSVPEWLSEELRNGRLRGERRLKKREKGKGYKAKPRQSAYGCYTTLLDAILTGEFGVPTRLRASDRQK